MGYEDDGSTVHADPVTDWVNDWDWLDDQWGTQAIDIWNEIRETTPMAMTERYGRPQPPRPRCNGRRRSPSDVVWSELGPDNNDEA